LTQNLRATKTVDTNRFHLFLSICSNPLMPLGRSIGISIVVGWLEAMHDI
jgi:hypothetical protein